jgi:fatty-acid desaturase
VHILALAGLIYFIIQYDKAKHVLPYFVGFWFTYALGITGGAHRLWAHKSY